MTRSMRTYTCRVSRCVSYSQRRCHVLVMCLTNVSCMLMHISGLARILMRALAYRTCVSETRELGTAGLVVCVAHGIASPQLPTDYGDALESV